MVLNRYIYPWPKETDRDLFSHLSMLKASTDSSIASDIHHFRQSFSKDRIFSAELSTKEEASTWVLHTWEGNSACQSARKTFYRALMCALNHLNL